MKREVVPVSLPAAEGEEEEYYLGRYSTILTWLRAYDIVSLIECMDKQPLILSELLPPPPRHNNNNARRRRT